MYNKKVLFVGMPDMALVCLSKLVNAGVNIVAVVPPEKNSATYGFFMEFVHGMNLRVIDYDSSLKEQLFLNKIKALEADIAVVCSYNKLFPPEFLKLTKDGFINVHPSLLPEYRGGNPYSHVIINNEKETGVTIHFMDETFDTGDIISQYRVDIEEKDTMGTLFNRLNFLAADVLLHTLNFYEKNSTLPRVKQAEGEYKKAYAIDIKYGNSIIDWNKPAVEIERFVRALNPFISAGTRYRGTYTKINTAFVQNKKHKLQPGSICHIKDSIGVACGEDILHIKTLQVGSYVTGDAKDFTRIFNPKIGEMLE